MHSSNIGVTAPGLAVPEAAASTPAQLSCSAGFADIRSPSQTADAGASPANRRAFAGFAENAGVAPASANLIASSDDASPAANGGGVRDQAEQDKSDSAIAEVSGKVFATLQAELALRGFTLSRSSADDGTVRFVVARWNLSRELPGWADVVAFAEQVGVRNGA